jgi:hypothetical protein
MKTILAALLLTCSMLLSACASHKPGVVPLKETAQYTNFKESNGLEVAADLYAEESKTKEGFYLNVNEKSFYPVNLVVKNNTSSRFLLLKSNVKILDSKGSEFGHTPCTIMTSEFERNKMAYALLGFGIFSYMSAEEANKKMEADWRDKELADEVIINPNRRNSGFLYFKFPEGIKPTGMTLKLILESLDTKEQVPFEIIL